MHIEIAQRLVELRKQNGLSQEELAARLGLSRQAVSKWERAESSPDTDNLIALADLYNISIDALLKMSSEAKEDVDFENRSRTQSTDTTADSVPDSVDSTRTNERDTSAKNGKAEYVHIGLGGIHVKDETEEVHVGWDGIHVTSSLTGEDVHVDRNGVIVNGEHWTLEEAHKKWVHHTTRKCWMYRFPYPFLALVIYLCIGFLGNLWHPGWLVLLTIPIWYGIAAAVENHDTTTAADCWNASDK